MGLYNKTDIFVMADHGNDGYVQPNYEQNPLFMVKKAGEEKSFSVSEIKLSYHDLSIRPILHCSGGRCTLLRWSTR